MNARPRSHVVFWAVLLVGVAADLVSKYVISLWLSGRPDRAFDVWPRVFRFEMRENHGGVWSLFTGCNPLFVVVSLLALGVIIYLYLREARRGVTPTLAGLALVASGAVGNLYDRLALGHVRDFLSFYLINYPVFNLADVFITMGALLLVVELVRRRPAEVSAAAPKGG